MKREEFKSFRRGRDIEIDPRTKIIKNKKDYNRRNNMKMEDVEDTCLNCFKSLTMKEIDFCVGCKKDLEELEDNCD